MIEHDVLVVGGGLAGLRTAVELCRHWDVASFPRSTRSVPIPGPRRRDQCRVGQFPDGRDDSPERHAFDTIRGSDYLADQAAVAGMCAWRRR